MLFLVLAGTAFAQEAPLRDFFQRNNTTDRSGQFYFYWGYNRAAFSKSDIHFHGPEYDFTIYDVEAHDRPTPLNDAAYYTPKLMTIPQFNFRVGYEITHQWAVSLGWDHMKYVMDQYQTALVSGYVNHPVNTQYNGSYLLEPVMMDPDFVKFEHTDGLNAVSLDLERRFPLFRTRGNGLSLHSVTGIGGSVVIPRSDVRVMGVGLNNHWHISGYHLNVKTGLRLEFLRNGFFQAETRAGYINLPNVLIQNDRAHRANHSFFFMEWSAVVGMYVKVF